MWSTKCQMSWPNPKYKLQVLVKALKKFYLEIWVTEFTSGPDPCCFRSAAPWDDSLEELQQNYAHMFAACSAEMFLWWAKHKCRHRVTTHCSQNLIWHTEIHVSNCSQWRRKWQIPVEMGGMLSQQCNKWFKSLQFETILLLVLITPPMFHWTSWKTVEHKALGRFSSDHEHTGLEHFATLFKSIKSLRLVEIRNKDIWYFCFIFCKHVDCWSLSLSVFFFKGGGADKIRFLFLTLHTFCSWHVLLFCFHAHFAI